MSNCATHEDLIAYLADELPLEARVRIGDHVANCERCQRILTEERAESSFCAKLRQAYRSAHDGERNEHSPLPASHSQHVPSVSGFQILAEINLIL